MAATIPLIFLHSVVPIVLLVAVLGAAASLTGATWSALIPRVVGEDHLAEAVSAQQSLNVLVLVGAPAVGGLLAGAFGSGVPVAIDAATFVVVTVAAALIRTRRVPERVPAVDGASRVRGGFAILRADPVLAPLLAGVALVVLLVGMVDVVLVYLVRDTLHAGGVWYGVAEASWMAGMVAGSLGAGRVGTEPGQVRATIAGAALACAGVAGFAVAPAVGILVPLSVLGGIGNGYAGSLPVDPAHDTHSRQRTRPGVRHRQRDLRRRPGRLAPARGCRRGRAVAPGDLRPCRRARSGGRRTRCGDVRLPQLRHSHASRRVRRLTAPGGGPTRAGPRGRRA